MRLPMFRILAVLSLMFLSGCGALGAIGEATTPLDTYELRAPLDGPTAQGQPRAVDLVVEVPEASGALDTDRIMIRPNPFQAQYLPRARWADTAPEMIQTLMLRSVENSNAVRYVGRRPLAGAGDYALISEITDFQAERRDGDDAAEIRLRMTARLVREDDASIVATRTFTATADVDNLDTLPVVASFDAAAAPMLREIAQWVMQTLGVPAATS